MIMMSTTARGVLCISAISAQSERLLVRRTYCHWHAKSPKWRHCRGYWTSALGEARRTDKLLETLDTNCGVGLYDAVMM